MPKTKISEFDIDPANNTDINSINIAEGCAPSGINNAIRQLMSDLKEFQTGAGGDSITATGVYSDTIGEKTSAAGVTVDGVLLKDNAVTASGGFSGALNGAVGGTTPAAGAFTTLSASGAFSANGGATLGDASGDALTINSSAVSIPNGLNFDSNTLVIDATNNAVGVGTSSPSQPVELVKNQDAATWFSASNNNAGTGAAAGYLMTNNTGVLGALQLNSSTNTTSGAGNAVVLRTLSTNPLVFGTNSTERMRLDSSGNLGIGTSSPAYKLDIVSSGLGTYPIVARNSANGATIFKVGNASNGNGTLDILGGNGTSVALSLDSSGNLGLGVTPQSSFSNYKSLEIGSAGNMIFSGLSDSYFTNNAYYNSGWKYGSTGYSATAYNQNGGKHLWQTASSGTAGAAITFTTAMTLDASGRLAIGTTTPGAKFTVADSSNAEMLLKRGSSTGFIINQYDSSGNASLNLVDSANLLFATGNTERMRIDSSGNLLVGTTSVQQSSQLTVAGYIATNGITSHAGTGGAYGTNRFNLQWTGSPALWVDTTNIGNIQLSSDYRIKRNIQTYCS